MEQPKKLIQPQNLKLSKNLKVALTIRNVATKLLQIMEKHISCENAISRSRMYKAIFGIVEGEDLEDWLRWEFVRKAMHFCRKRTKCFIANENRNGKYYYFVIKDDYDAECYIQTLEKNIKRMRVMQAKALEAVEKQWWKAKWDLPNSSRKLLE